jgi:hypothetical protein
MSARASSILRENDALRFLTQQPCSPSDVISITDFPGVIATLPNKTSPVRVVFCELCRQRKGEGMALTDSAAGKIIRDYSIEQLLETADLMRGYDLVAPHAAGSGHAGARFRSWTLRRRST